MTDQTDQAAEQLAEQNGTPADPEAKAAAAAAARQANREKMTARARGLEAAKAAGAQQAAAEAQAAAETAAAPGPCADCAEREATLEARIARLEWTTRNLAKAFATAAVAAIVAYVLAGRAEAKE